MMTSEDWNAIAAIGQCAGAAATFAAVLVALRAESRANAIRLAITTTPAVPPSEFMSGSNLRVVVVNRSNRPVTLMGGGVLLPEGSVSDNHHLQLRSLYEKTVKEWDRIEGDVSAEWLSQELDQKKCKTLVKLWIFVEDATGRRHWVKAYFDPAPYIAKRQATQRAHGKDLVRMIEQAQPSANALTEGSSSEPNSQPEKTA
jgi:hypothetical protein